MIMAEKTIRIAAIGLGNRTCKYLRFVKKNPSVAMLTAIADSDRQRLLSVQERFGLEDQACFTSPDEFFSTVKDVDICIIGTPDKYHYDMTVRALGNGWNVLLEKPMAQDIDECRKIAELSQQTGLLVSVCYVLRYHPYFVKMKELTARPDMGRILSVKHVERVGIDRTTHTYVRGPWTYKEMNTSMFFSKCCHDVDFVLWLTGNDVRTVSSFREGRPFDPSLAPKGAASRCICCSKEGTCRYSAVDLYLRRRDWIKGFIPYPDEEERDTILRMLSESRFGRCVYNCTDTDAVDRQTVVLEMESGIRSEIVMECITEEDNRLTEIQCENAVISGDETTIYVRFKDGREDESYDFSWTKSLGYHANADFHIIEDLITAVASGRKELRTSAADAVVSHIVCLKTENPFQ